MDSYKKNVHIEILQAIESSLSNEEICRKVEKVLKEKKSLSAESRLEQVDLCALKPHVLDVKVCEAEPPSEEKYIDLSVTRVEYHVYKLDYEGASNEEINGTEGEDIPAVSHWILPSSDFVGLWESLIYDTEIKEQLLNFVTTTLLFSDRGVDSSIISWNRVLLLHGPPGTGKTSLCKALAQKLSIRLRGRYDCAQLLEVNSHSLFSKWFSESGKLVQKLFSKITELVDDPQSLVCVLIDEVESLTRARATTAGGSDPGDALRVVNALLTQIDQIKRQPNVLILTTSNVAGVIDLAFVDRADMKQFIGLPSQAAIYEIYHSCLTELMQKKLIAPKQRLLTLRQLRILNMSENEVPESSMELWSIAEESVGLSGRSLRKMPFLAHALYVRTEFNSLPCFLKGMRAAVQKHKLDEAGLSASSL